MKRIIEEAQKNANDSTRIQLPTPSDNNNEKINNSPVLNTAPDEQNENAIPQKTISESEVASVSPIHDPGKPLKNPHSVERKSVIRHPSLNEKPRPTLRRKAWVKKATVKKQEETTKEEAKVPKAIMPPKSDY